MGGGGIPGQDGKHPEKGALVRMTGEESGPKKKFQLKRLMKGNGGEKNRTKINQTRSEQ